MALAACFGSPPRFTKTTVWYPAVIDDLEAWQWRFDPETNPHWQHILAIQQHLIDANRGRYFLGKPELGNAADVLSLMRGMERLAMDLIDRPEAVARAVEVLSGAWVDLMERVYRMNGAANDGGDVLAWMSLWAPGRHDQIACDYSSLISPAQFRRFFVPDIRRMGGVVRIRHLSPGRPGRHADHARHPAWPGGDRQHRMDPGRGRAAHLLSAVHPRLPADPGGRQAPLSAGRAARDRAAAGGALPRRGSSCARTSPAKRTPTAC